MKKQIRKEILALRKTMPISLLEEKSRIITGKVIRHSVFQSAECIFCYIDAKGEVRTKDIIEYAWSQGKKVAVPKVHGEIMEFYYITAYDQLEEGNFGIQEPKESCQKVKCIPENSIVIMPGVAFDMRGNRIGYGKGYSDKYFSKNSNLYKMAIAFSIQILPEILADEFDVRANCVIIEENEKE